MRTDLDLSFMEGYLYPLVRMYEAVCGYGSQIRKII